MKKGFVVAIDGPVASGKGTIAHKLSEQLKGFDLYTGAMYRSLALFCLENNINMSNSEDVEKALSQFDIDLTDTQVVLNGKDITERIKQNDAARMSAHVSPYPFVRRAMVKRQQEIGERESTNGRIVIAEGRDTGTVVFPNADVKFYLTATDEVRAKRRYDQYQRQGDDRSFEDVLHEIKERDKRDMTRETDPLVSNPEEKGYVVLDNSSMNEEQTLLSITDELKKRNLLHD
jgi:cytidylate kinase